MIRNTIAAAILAILAAACILYGICIRRAGSGTGFYLVWFALAAYLVLLDLAFCTNRFPAALRHFLLFFTILMLAIIAVTWGCVLTGFHAQGEPGLDYVVVLGAQVKTTGPSRVLKARLDTAAQYLSENEDTRCITAGGKGPNEPEAEGEAMKTWLISHGISADRITAEDASRNTVQNLINSRPLLNPDSDHIGIVTNNFHMFRAIRLAKKQGYRHVCGISAPSNPLYLPNNMLRETAGILKDLIAGNL